MKRNSIIMIGMILLVLSLIPVILVKAAMAPEVDMLPTIGETTISTLPTETIIEETVAPTTEPIPVVIIPYQEFEYLDFKDKDSFMEYYYNLTTYVTELCLFLPEVEPGTEESHKLTAEIEEKQAWMADCELWVPRFENYPVASEVWLYMKQEFGWSDIMCAGVMGNLMAECGGCWTADLDWDINKSSGMGMVQWIGGRRIQLIETYGDNPTVGEQLLFMKDELYGTNGITKQVSESQLNKIINAETPEDCAFAFASYYERCAQQHRAIRRNYARRAYEYFVD